MAKADPGRASIADPSPARLFATLGGALLLLLGIAGFFASSSFGTPGTTGELFGVFEVNGWLNLLHAATGAIGLFLAGFAPRRYAMWTGVVYLGLAIYGFATGDGESILGFLPANTGDDFLHLAIAVLGIGSALGTGENMAERIAPPPREKRPRKPREKKPKPPRTKAAKGPKPKKPKKPKPTKPKSKKTKSTKPKRSSRPKNPRDTIN